jgi:hypothetical protein
MSRPAWKRAESGSLADPGEPDSAGLPVIEMRSSGRPQRAGDTLRDVSNEATAQDGRAEVPLAEREAQLAKVPFFDGLTPEALTMIAHVTTEETHPYGTRLFQYGDLGDKLYIILEGKVRISREVAGMGEEALAVLGAGEVFGEMASSTSPLGRPARLRTSVAACSSSRKTRSTICSFCTRTSLMRSSGAAFACSRRASAKRTTSSRFCRRPAASERCVKRFL